MRPSSIESGSEGFIREVDRRLRGYGNSRHFNKANPLDELIFIILSAQTESYSYVATFRALHKRFPNNQSLFNANLRKYALPNARF